MATRTTSQFHVRLYIVAKEEAHMKQLIEHENDCDKFYIDVEHGNEASERGLQKVGFTFFKKFGFIRGFKKTFNMYRLE